MNVILALDDLPRPDRLVQAVRALRLPSDTRITVAAVVTGPTFVGGLTLDWFFARGEDGKRLRQQQEESARRLLESCAQCLREAGRTVEECVLHGKTAEQILKLARDQVADLLVLDARGRSPSAGFALGSVAQQVMKHAPCSVLLVKEDIPKIDRILVGIDGSSNSEAAVQFLAELPMTSTARVFVVTVLNSHSEAFLTMPTMDLAENRRFLAKLQDTERKQAEEVLSRSSEPLEQRGFDFRSRVRRGDSTTELLDLIRTNQVQLVVVGAKGLTGIEYFLLGSVAHRIARRSPRSVLIVRPSGNA